MPNYSEIVLNTSEIFKALSHPARVCIVSRLLNENLNVNQMQECLDISQPNVSQHLNILKRLNIIKGTRNGSEIIYSLADDDVRNLMRIFYND